MKLTDFVIFLALSTLFFSRVRADERELKVLVLIISSDDFPGSGLSAYPYKGFQNNWRSYMHLDPEHVEAYFIRADPDWASLCDIQEDIIWSKTEENAIPGILIKTLLSMEKMLPRLKEFDYVLRTNLSSVFVFPRLFAFLKQMPRERFYCGSGCPDWASGSGFIMTPDVVEMLIAHKAELFVSPLPDDVVIGYFLKDKGINNVEIYRQDLWAWEQWDHYKTQIPSWVFHFRIKNEVWDLRPTIDVSIQSELIKMFYP